jgi:hypothetical protein
MSQAGFGDSSSQESISQESVESQSPQQVALQIVSETAPRVALSNIGSNTVSNIAAEPTTLFNALPRQVLEQELQFCNERSQQAQVLLRQAQEQLQLSQLVIQRQETLTQTLQARIDQLERELQNVHSSGEELRDRLKRQQHHTSQLKAALERCLDTSTSKETAHKDSVIAKIESWSIAKLADEKITPVEQITSSPQQSVVKIAPPLQPIEMPYGLGAAQDSELRPELRPESTPNSMPKSVGVREFGLQDLQEITSKDDSKPSYRHDSPISSTSATNSSRISTVVAPKFIRALYSYGSAENHESPEELAIANSSSRQPVKTLAAVQLPQFPPLPRR